MKTKIFAAVAGRTACGGDAVKDYKDDNVWLMLGGCLERMRDIPDGSVDLVLTSPPYNMNLRIRNGKYVSRQIVKELSTKYDDYDDNLPMDDYFNLLKGVVSECLRVSDLVFFNIQALTGNKPALYRLMGEYHDKIKELIIWDKVNAQPAIGSGILNSQFEMIIVFQNSAPESRKFSGANFDRGTMSNVWAIKRERQPIKGLGAAMPSELASLVIRSFADTGQTILDPFMGSGTTGIEAAKHGCNFIGVELSEKRFNIAKRRISEALK